MLRRTNHSTAYHQVFLLPETQHIVNFVVNNGQCKHNSGFCGFNALPGALAKQAIVLFVSLIIENEKKVILAISLFKLEKSSQMFDCLLFLHEGVRHSTLKAAPDKIFYVFIAVKYLAALLV